MKIYRVNKHEADGASDGFEFFTDKRKASLAQKKDNEFSGMDVEMYGWDVELTKKGVMAFLNSWCVHPDNG